MSGGVDEQCQAITQKGTQCSRLAKDGRFCFQHDESDDTVGEAEPAPQGRISIVTDRLQSVSVELSGVPRDVAQNLQGIIDEADGVAEAIRTQDFDTALGKFKNTVGETGPSAGKGALLGGVFGSPFGPVGIATGASVGGWYGVYRSLNDDRAVAASIADEVPEDATVVSSRDTAIVDVEPIQVAIRSAVESEEENESDWLRSTATRERDMDAVADALNEIEAHDAGDHWKQYFIRDEESGEVLLLLFGVPQEESEN